LFDHCLALELDLGELASEIESAEQYLDRLSCAVPFRDATPKNLSLAWPEIWRGRATPGQKRDLVRDAAAQWCLKLSGSSPLAEAPIVNIDFSSCDELTVPEDDPISLLLHEASWLGDLPKASQLLWLDMEPDPARLAIGMAVRLYRLGGRRLSYRLVHDGGYRARYADESIAFHFSRSSGSGAAAGPRRESGAGGSGDLKDPYTRASLRFTPHCFRHSFATALAPLVGGDAKTGA
jgi:hypothetical protein